MELTLITFVAVHLLAVNLAGAGPLVLVWLDWFGHRRQLPRSCSRRPRDWDGAELPLLQSAWAGVARRSFSLRRRERMPIITG